MFGIPPGVLAGVYLAEFGNTRLSRFDPLLRGRDERHPSITVGLFVYALVVMTTKHFSAYAGGLALAVLMLPDGHALDRRSS